MTVNDFLRQQQNRRQKNQHNKEYISLHSRKVSSLASAIYLFMQQKNGSVPLQSFTDPNTA